MPRSTGRSVEVEAEAVVVVEAVAVVARSFVVYIYLPSTST